MIAIIDYGMGNIHSVNKALQAYGAETIITNKPTDIQLCDKLILPGVGAFGDAMLELKKQKLITALLAHIKSKKPFLGICLGMQLLFEKSQEVDQTSGKATLAGLGVLKGMVKKFQDQKNLKVPHIGWNQIKAVNRLASEPVSRLNRQTGKPANRQTQECPLLKDVPDNSYVYFCHSYYPDPKDKSIIAATTDYGTDFTSCVWKDNVYGAQFHPEKSQSIGLKILKNFIELC